MLIKLSHRDGESLVGLAHSPHWRRFILRLFRFWEPTRDAETMPPSPVVTQVSTALASIPLQSKLPLPFPSIAS